MRGAKGGSAACVSESPTLRSEHSFKDAVVPAIHSKRFIDALRSPVSGVDIQPKARGVSLVRLGYNLAIESRKIAQPPMLQWHVDGLNPPDESIAPIAPFVGDKELRTDSMVDFEDPIARVYR